MCKNVSYIVNFLLTLRNNSKYMDTSQDTPLFKLIALKDAIEFLDNLPDKAREKVLYNIRKVRFGVKDPELFKKIDNEIWEFRTAYMGMAYAYLPFGIMMAKHL